MSGCTLSVTRYLSVDLHSAAAICTLLTREFEPGETQAFNYIDVNNSGKVSLRT